MKSPEKILKHPKIAFYDFYGKKLGNLFTGYQSEGQFILKEDENWKVFNRFKGIVYFTLTVDGQLVTKKLLAKVE